jgi:tetratricopeptide (TPR) repeat protein
MWTMKSKPGRGCGALALLLVLGVTAAARTDDDTDLRKKALKLNEVTGDEPTKGRIKELVADPAGTKKLLAAAALIIKDKKEQPFNVNATFILAKTAQELKQFEISNAFYRLNTRQADLLKSGRRLKQGYDGWIQLLFENKKYAECEKACKEFLDIEGDETVEEYKLIVFRRLILFLSLQGKTDQAVAKLDAQLKEQPDNWLYMELKARVLRSGGKLEESLKLYKEVLDRVKKDKRLDDKDRDAFLADVQYALSGVYIDLGQVDKAADVLKALLVKDPDNPSYLNDLGYIWADHDKNLDEAEKLIRKALDEDRKQRRKANPKIKPEEDRDNPSYLDSMGWVLFKQKKYKEAKEFLLKAVADEDGQHLEIYDHLGDVYLALEEKAEAVKAWKKAIEVANPSKREQERKVALAKKVKDNE